MRIKSFLKSTSGNVAMMLGIMAVPLLLAVSAGMDILRQNDAQTLLQAATDAAAIAGSSFAQTDLGKAKTAAEHYLTENEAYKAIAASPLVETGIDKGTGDFYVRVSGTINTTFMGLVGINSLDVGAFASVSTGGQDLEVALVLDNTASMGSEGRLDGLKSAAKSLVDTVFKAKAPNGYLKVGIVPFANYVNVGMSNRSSSWMDVPADWDEVQKNHETKTYPNATGCRTVNLVWNNDGTPVPYTDQVCDNPGTPVITYSDVMYPHRWYGCVGSRPDPLDRNIGSLGKRYPGILDTSCPSPITDLTDKQATLNSQIDAMTAVGETYIPQGLLWGWNILNSDMPYTTAKTKAEMAKVKGTKSVVLMTDGENTVYPDYTPTNVGKMHHYPTDYVPALNATNDRMVAICDNIKADGIVIYTVAFKVTKQSSKDLLTKCASSATDAFDASDSGSLLAAFNEIGNSIAQIRFTK